VLVGLVVSCAGGDTTIDVVHDPCGGVTLASAVDSTLQDQGIDAAIALWVARGIVVGHAADTPVVEVVFEPASQAFHGVYDDERGVIYINDGLTDPEQLAIVIAHELGHAFGLVHVSGRPSLMNKGNLVTPPTANDLLDLQALWGTCSSP